LIRVLVLLDHELMTIGDKDNSYASSRKRKYVSLCGNKSIIFASLQSIIWK
jgi:hypothetical protein